MKTIRFASQIIVAITVILALQSCSKDRIENSLTQYESLEEYFSSKKQQEQVYVIDTNGTCPLTGLYGTRICINKADLQFPNGDSVYFPYTLRLLELYTIKDMMYHGVLNNSDQGKITSKGEIRIRTTKNEIPLELRDNKSIEVEIKDSLATESLLAFVENTTLEFEWKETTTEYTQTDYGYLGMIPTFGWNTAAKTLQFEEPVTLTFESETDDLETVSMYVYLPEYKTIYAITNHESIQVPESAEVKIIMIAIDKNKQLYHYYNQKTVKSSETFTVSLSKISDDELTAILDDLQ